MFCSKAELDKIKNDIKKDLRHCDEGYEDYGSLSSDDYRKLMFKTSVVIIEQNEKMIRVLNKINHNIIRTIDFSR